MIQLLQITTTKSASELVNKLFPDFNVSSIEDLGASYSVSFECDDNRILNMIEIRKKDGAIRPFNPATKKD